MSIPDLELERIASRGWQAAHERWLGAWLLRADGGFTGRANSVLPLGEPDRGLDDALVEVGRWYATFGLQPRFMLPRPACASLRADLVGRGWTPSGDVDVMVAPLDVLPRPSGTDGVEVRTHPSPAWRELFHLRDVEDPAVAWALLQRVDVVAFAHVHDGDAVVAVGRGSVVEGWLGVTSVATRADHRRRGLATAVLAALGAWARTRGATHAYLQVSVDNDAARTMYRRHGFTSHHTYAYLASPHGG